MHLPGVPAADRRPGFQGFLSLHVVLQRLKKVFEKISKKVLTNPQGCVNISESSGGRPAAKRKRSGRVVELVDSLDSGSSVHYGRAGSSPASPTRIFSSSRSLYARASGGIGRLARFRF